jgi:hypothetical protein
MHCIQNAYNLGRSSLWRCVEVLECISSDCISLVLWSCNHTNHIVSLLLKHYSPLWTLAFNRISPRYFRSLAILCQFLNPMSSERFYNFSTYLFVLILHLSYPFMGPPIFLLSEYSKNLHFFWCHTVQASAPSLRICLIKAKCEFTVKNILPPQFLKNVDKNFEIYLEL